jgi:hypothetical protein
LAQIAAFRFGNAEVLSHVGDGYSMISTLQSSKKPASFSLVAVDASESHRPLTIGGW